MNWGEVPFPDQLGIIQGYRVLMWRTNQSADILRDVTLLAPTRTVSFSGLEKYTNYTIQVLAFTVKGEGNKSEPIVVTTDEDGKWRCSVVWYSLNSQGKTSDTLGDFICRSRRLAYKIADIRHVRYRRLNSPAFTQCARSRDFLRPSLRISSKVNQSV